MQIGDEDPRLGKALAAVAKGHQAQTVFQYLEEYLLGRQARLDTELFNVPPAEWDSIVRQKIEAHLFLQNLYQLMKAGEGSAKLLQPYMELHGE